MDMMEVLRTRRTFRAFTQEPVPQDVLADILEAGRLANCVHNIIVLFERKIIGIFR